MPVTAGKLKALKKGVDFDYLGDSVHVEYHPAALSAQALIAIQDIYMRMDAAQNNPDITDAEAEALMLETGAWVADVFAGWDYLEDDPAMGKVGEPILITPERVVFELKRFPDFMTACIAAVGKDYRQGKANGTPSSERSGAISSRKGRSASRKASQNRSASASSRAG